MVCRRFRPDRSRQPRGRCTRRAGAFAPVLVFAHLSQRPGTSNRDRRGAEPRCLARVVQRRCEVGDREHLDGAATEADQKAHSLAADRNICCQHFDPLDRSGSHQTIKHTIHLGRRQSGTALLAQARDLVGCYRAIARHQKFEHQVVEKLRRAMPPTIPRSHARLRRRMQVPDHALNRHGSEAAS